MLKDIWCLRGQQWDNNLPDDVSKKFLEWAKELPNLSEITIPRCYFRGIMQSNEIHVIGDSSQNVFSAVAFLSSGFSSHVLQRAPSISKLCHQWTPAAASWELRNLFPVGSDIGTNFVATEKELLQNVLKWNHQSITESNVKKGVNWKFNPSSAPDYSGVWERLVRCFKHTFSTILGNRRLTDDILPGCFVLWSRASTCDRWFQQAQEQLTRML